MEQRFEVVYDRDSDVLAIILNKNKKNKDFVEIAPGVFVWIDEKNEVRMIEILRTSRLLERIKGSQACQRT